MEDLVFWRNITSIFNIILLFVWLLEGPPVHRDTYIQYLQNTHKLLHLQSEVTICHSHMEMIENTSNISTDVLYHIYLSLTAVLYMLLMGK